MASGLGFCQYSNIDNDLRFAFAMGIQSARVFCLAHITPDHAYGNSGALEASHGISCMIHSGAEHHGLSIASFFFPMLNNGIVNGPRIHDVRDRAYVIIKGGLRTLLSSS
ncbi:hypothetical protein RLOatenuis_1380 [Rickettsiales bacterium]|nr:hypothetical protein RLOatenuis_1380 [Rickettsiales bacterium]